METLEEISYGLALRALGQQEAALGELRSRTGTLLTASSLIASFLGGQALARAGLSGFVVAALAALGVSLTLTIYVLAPNHALRFGVDGTDAYRRLYDLRDDPSAMKLDLVSWLEAYRAGNEEAVLRLTRAFRGASAAVVAEIALFALALGLT